MDAATLFFAVATQWRATLAGVVGLDYDAVARVAKWRRVKISPAMFNDLQIMEQAALTVLNERKR